MKKSLPEFYSPSPDKYKELWEKALIVLDTNVVLNVYRLPAAAREEFIAVLELVKDRLWVPYQVALEFQRRRLTVIAAERKVTEDVLSSARDMVSEMRTKVEALQMDKRGVNARTEPLIQNLESANAELIKALESAHAAQLDISANDPIRDRLDGILSGRVGPAPKTQVELDKLVEDGEFRFNNKIPPGFADAEKDKNPAEASFIHDHIRYERKYGDLIIWRQLLTKASSENIKHVILVTADRKEDWWWREHGKTVGPHPELIREITREASVDLFWMYSSVQFLEHAKTYAKAKVSTESVEELREVADSPRPTRRVLPFSKMMPSLFPDTYGSLGKNQKLIDQKRAELAVFEWLREKHRNITRGHREFADFVVQDESGSHGFEILLSAGVMNLVGRDVLKPLLLRAYFEISEGSLNYFTIVIVINENEFASINSDQMEELREDIERQIYRHQSVEVVVGTIFSGSPFEPLLFCGRNRPI